MGERRPSYGLGYPGSLPCYKRAFGATSHPLCVVRVITSYTWITELTISRENRNAINFYFNGQGNSDGNGLRHFLVVLVIPNVLAQVRSPHDQYKRILATQIISWVDSSNCEQTLQRW